MKSRNRVLLSASHKKPDRLPLFKPNIMDTIEPYQKSLLGFLDSFDFDSLDTTGTFKGAPGERRDLGNNEFIDAYGCRFRYRGVGLPYCTFSPLEKAETVAEVEKYKWPDPEAVEVEILNTNTDNATTAYVPQLFHQYHYIRGFEQWMLDIKENRAVHQAITERIFHTNMVLIMRLLEKVSPKTDIVSAGDDLGWSQSSYMSPEDFRSLIKPYIKKMISEIKSKYPQIKFYLHSHGQIMDLVPDLIECGVDILNPILPLDNMDPVRLKREYGDQLCFHGGIDVEEIIPFGTVDQVRAHVRETIDVLAEGGGYWFKLQVISPVIPPENIIAAYELAREFSY